MACRSISVCSNSNLCNKISYAAIKVLGYTLCSLSIPIISIIAGVVGTVLLIVKTVYLLIIHALGAICKTNTISLYQRFSCIIHSPNLAYLAPILLIPVIGNIVYVTFLLNKVTSHQESTISCSEALCLSACSPCYLMLDSLILNPIIPHDKSEKNT